MLTTTELSGTVLIEVGGTRIRAAAMAPRGLGRRVVRATRPDPCPDRPADRPGDLAAAPPDGSLDGSPADPPHGPTGDPLDGIVAAVAAAGSQVGTGPITRAVVAWPGPVAPDGQVYASPTIPGLAAGRTDVAGRLARAWPGAQVHLLNDLVAAGLRLVAEGEQDFAVITVGSGIGHKVFHRGEALVGPAGRGGELGHLRIDPSPEAVRCDCGGRGHLGAVASGRAIVRAAGRRWQADDLTGDPGPEVVAAFHAGEPAVRAAVRRAAEALGAGLAALHLGVGVELFVLVGGFPPAAGEPYRRLVARAAAQSCWDLGLDWDRAVRLGRPDDDHGLLGCREQAVRLGWCR
jgi:C7-cyclitol 7-kinase